jgi:hypothetical protein
LDDVTLVGAGHGLTIIDGFGHRRVLDINAAAHVVVSNLTVQGGAVGNSSYYGASCGYTPKGGGIHNLGVLELHNVNVLGNKIVSLPCDVISQAPNVGAGIYNEGSLLMVDSTISENVVEDVAGVIFLFGGGGVWNEGGVVTLVGSTISANGGGDADYGGGIGNAGGEVSIVNSTISGNVARHGGGVTTGYGSGIVGGTVRLINSTVTLNEGVAGVGGVAIGSDFVFGDVSALSVMNARNSIIAQNKDISGGGTDDCAGDLTTEGYNLIGSGAGCSGVTDGVDGDQVGTAAGPLDPQLGVLASNGGPSQTYALLPGSPALDAGNPASPGNDGSACESTDQRGYSRPQGARCDIGAVEGGAMAINNDFDGDRYADLMWRKTTTGASWFYFMKDAATPDSEGAGPTVSTNWSPVGVGDFDGDGRDDVLWRKSNGATWFHLMNGNTVASEGAGNFVDPAWTVETVADFNGDGKDDIYWRKSNGATWFYLMDAMNVASEGAGNSVPLLWTLQGAGDFDGDGKDDLFWRRQNGATWFYLMDGMSLRSQGAGNWVDPAWEVQAVADFDGDGKADIWWRKPTTGASWFYFMDGMTVSSQSAGATVPTAWQPAAVRDFSGDGKADILWRKSNGATWFHFMNGAGVASEGPGNSVSPEWQVVDP